MIRNDLCYALAAGRPMLIDPLKARAFLANANAILSNPDLALLLQKGANHKAKGLRADDDDTETAPGQPMAGAESMAKDCTPYVRDGIGIIPVRGVIGKGLSYLESMLGCADIDVISKQLDTWKERDDIFEILFDIDSGGGSTTGLEELAKKIRNYNKVTIGFTESDCGSAAYWIGSQCKRFVCTPSASVGACGVYITLTDESEKWAKEGKSQVVIKSGKYKAAGVEGTKLTDAQYEDLQREVDELHSRFIRDVRSVRQFAEVEDLQGQSFYGDFAAARGLATGVVDSLEVLIDDIKSTRRFAVTNTLPTYYQSNNIINTNPYAG